MAFPVVEFFQEKEFTCKCCNKNKTDIMFLMNLVRARRMAQTPFKINSGYRCENHNKTIGGSPTSSHLKGCAADIACTNDEQRQKILSALICSGFKRIGIAQDFIHVDSDTDKPARIWIYQETPIQKEDYDFS